MEGKRLDLLLVDLGLADSREKAKAYIEAGTVQVNGKIIKKPSAAPSPDSRIELVGEVCPYVSRGGLKLKKALDCFGIVPGGYVCIDSGASTGGFTDCLLQSGAKKVFAVDVGTAQLADRLKADSRVVSMEQTNIRYLNPEDIGEKADLATLDLSFISLDLVLPAVKQLLKPNGQILCLIKPQFEAGKGKVGKKGVVKDPVTHREVLEGFIATARSLGFCIKGITFSPVKGPEGNIEFLGHLAMSGEQSSPDTAEVVRQAHLALDN